MLGKIRNELQKESTDELIEFMEMRRDIREKYSELLHDVLRRWRVLINVHPL